MAHVSIIGTGTMGQAIADVVTKGGNTAELIGHTDSGKPATGEIVVLAVPYPAVADVLATRGDQLAGKVVVDITNPLNFETFDSLTVPADSSAAAEIAAALPQSKVVKALNTTLAATVASGAVGDLPTTVLIAGDDAEAKSQLADVLTDGGLRVIDAGGLRRAPRTGGIGLPADHPGRAGEAALDWRIRRRRLRSPSHPGRPSSPAAQLMSRPWEH
jgi:8-hydroxy-5-deazaflavin:NADPH oxidoreductase